MLSLGITDLPTLARCYHGSRGASQKQPFTSRAERHQAHVAGLAGIGDQKAVMQRCALQRQKVVCTWPVLAFVYLYRTGVKKVPRYRLYVLGYLFQDVLDRWSLIVSLGSKAARYRDDFTWRCSGKPRWTMLGIYICSTLLLRRQIPISFRLIGFSRPPGFEKVSIFERDLMIGRLCLGSQQPETLPQAFCLSPSRHEGLSAETALSAN